MQSSNLPLWLIPVIPALGALWNGLLGKRASKGAVATVAIGATAASFLLSLACVISLGGAARLENHFQWITAGPLDINFSFLLDPLSSVMCLIVTGVGLLIHIYAAGYMADDDGYYRFFAYMNLFLFFMLLLVLGGNYLLMFVGWEGVGLCSFLLIGFYFKIDKAGDAAKKAFITTRIGDFGFLIALVLIYWTFDSLDFGAVFTSAASMQVEHGWGGPLTLICLLLLMGACGKSGQIPLYVWLPDAMMGPTPVSALIHAATMVTAGVYMIARSSALYVRAPEAMMVVAFIGAITAFYASTIGILQNDIKRVLAYSTISQIGYMIMACGLMAYSAAVFHLMTHAFFKALLFLGAGSVIHAVHGEQDIWKMGGLKKYLPKTYWTFLFACLALAAVPPFSGFFSKEEIISGAYESPIGGTFFVVVALSTAAITSFYIFRLFFLTFHGENRTPAPDHHAGHGHGGHGDGGIHESPAIMTVPLMILAALSLGGGWLGERFLHYLEPVFEPALSVVKEAGPGREAPHMLFTALSVAVSAAGISLAYFLYVKRTDLPAKIEAQFRGLYNLVFNKYFVDEIYQTLIIRPLVLISTYILWKVMDSGVIDGIVNGTASAARGAGAGARQLQSGNTRAYAAWLLAGALFLIAFMIVVES